MDETIILCVVGKHRLVRSAELPDTQNGHTNFELLENSVHRISSIGCKSNPFLAKISKLLLRGCDEHLPCFLARRFFKGHSKEMYLGIR